MSLDTRNSTIAFALMVLITLLNLGLITNLLAAGGSALAAALNSQNVYALAGLELVLVLVAYIAAKHQPLPVRHSSARR